MVNRRRLDSKEGSRTVPSHPPRRPRRRRARAFYFSQSIPLEQFIAYHREFGAGNVA